VEKINKNPLETSGEDLPAAGLPPPKLAGWPSAAAAGRDHAAAGRHRDFEEPDFDPLDEGVTLEPDLSYSIRVYFPIFCTRFECIFISFPLVSSVV
jgi:hypothetical protein